MAKFELVSEFEPDLRDTGDWCKKWLVDFNAGETELVSFDQSNNNGSIDVKMDGSFLEEKSSLEMLGLTFCSKFDWGVLHYLHSSIYLEENWSFDSFYKVSFC